MTTEFWNKKTPINGIAADRILDDPFFANARTIFLVKEGDITTRIESVDVIKANNKLTGMTDEEVMQWYTSNENSTLGEQTQINSK